MKKTILQVLPRLRSGGVERGTIEIATAIVRSGGQALVASEGGTMLPSLAYAGATHITLPLASKNPFIIWQNSAKLTKIINDYGVDLVHARSRAPAWSAYLAAKHTNKPFVTTFHGIYGLKPSPKKYYNEVMTKGDRVIAVSNFVARHIEENYAIDKAKLRVIHRGVDLEVFSPELVNSQRIADLVTNWRLPDDVPIILMPGRITRWKGQHILVEALAKLPHRKFFCLLLGDDMGHPDYRKEVEAQIVKLGLEGNIRVVGHTQAMSESYMLADIVLSPAIEPEAFGRVPVEAQAMGKIVISTNHGGACETISNGETGFLVKPNDAADLAQAIENVLNMSAQEKEIIGKQAIESVRKNFSADIMRSKTLDVYRELL